MPDIAADFSKPAWHPGGALEWVPSPQAGVERVMLDRVGDEVAVATSFVRYAPGSTFPTHEHGLGEEFLVLEGEFGDEHGRYPPGAYLRNPPGTRHAPFSEPGCIIFVKLRQFDEADQRQLAVALNLTPPAQACVERELHRHRGEVVREITAAAGADVHLPAAPVIQELLVIEGAVEWRDEAYERFGWIRVPAGEPLTVRALQPTHLFTKTRPFYRQP